MRDDVQPEKLKRVQFGFRNAMLDQPFDELPFLDRQSPLLGDSVRALGRRLFRRFASVMYISKGIPDFRAESRNK